MLLFVYGVSGLLAGLGGVMSAARLFAANGLQLGQSYELDAIAAVILGGTSFVGGIGSIWGTLIGALIIAVLSNGLILVGVSDIWQFIIKGLVIIGAVALDRFRTAGQRPHLSGPECQRRPVGNREPVSGSRRATGPRRRQPNARPGRKRHDVEEAAPGGRRPGAAPLGSASAKDLKSIGITARLARQPVLRRDDQGRRGRGQEDQPERQGHHRSADYDLNKQVTQIDNFIAAGVDLILLNAADPKAIAPGGQAGAGGRHLVVAVDVAAAGRRRHGDDRQRQGRRDLLPVPGRQDRRQGQRDHRERPAGLLGDRPREGLQAGLRARTRASRSCPATRTPRARARAASPSCRAT